MRINATGFYKLLFCFTVFSGYQAIANETRSTIDVQQVQAFGIFQECDVCPEMIALPLGTFTMGAPLEESKDLRTLRIRKPGEPAGRPTEGPPHEVEVDRPFALGRNEITRREWRACVDDGGCAQMPRADILTRVGTLIADDPLSPVIYVSYLDMQEYLAWLNSKVGAQVYRLPTEVEWEYGARAGSTTPFARGKAPTRDQEVFIVFDRGESGSGLSADENYFMPLPVDQLDAANAWGLRHMGGNVSERTMSCWSDRHLELPTLSAHLEYLEDFDTCRRVSKGGRFKGHVLYTRPAHRGRGNEKVGTQTVGSRVLRVLEGTLEDVD